MNLKPLQRQIRKLQISLRNNPTLDEAEDAPQTKEFEDEVQRVIQKQADTVANDQQLIDEILLILSKVAVSQEGLDKLSQKFPSFMSLVKQTLFFGFFNWAGTQGGQSGLDKLGSDETFDLRNEAVIGVLEQRGLELARIADQSTKEEIIRIMTKGRQDLLTNFEISELVSAKFVDISQRRAEIIALNELANAINLVEFETFKRNGVISVRWVTVLDERVCPICEPLHNTIVGTGNNFVGSENDSIVFTGERPPAHINCRCFLEEVIDEFEVREERIVWTGQ